MMKQTKRYEKLITYAGIACLSMAAFFCPTSTITVKAEAPAATETTISPRAHDIRWVFKEENGKTYRRLYDFTINDFAAGSSWQLVG